MPRITRAFAARIAWCVVLALGPVARSGAVGLVGATRAAVIAYYGPPSSLMKVGGKEILIYSNGRAVLEGGIATQITLPYPKPDDAAVLAEKAAAQAREARSVAIRAEEIEKLRFTLVPTPAPAPEIPVESSSQILRYKWVIAALSGISVFAIVLTMLSRRNGHKTSPKPKAAPAPAERATVNLPRAVPTVADRVAEENTVVLSMRAPVAPVAPPISPAVAAALAKSKLTPTLLAEIEWRRFEELVCGYYRVIGARPELTRAGANGGVDLRLYRTGEHRPYSLVQCKAWVDRDVDAAMLGSLFSIMTADGIGEGAIVTPNGFTPDARTFAIGKKIQLIDGPRFRELFAMIPIADQETMVAEATRGDYRTPTCPQCSQKMVQKDSPEGRQWACTGFPHCHAKPLRVREAVSAVSLPVSETSQLPAA